MPGWIPSEAVAAHAHAALGACLVILAIRCLPFVMAFSAANRCHPLRRGVAVWSYTVLAYLALVLGDLDWTTLIVAYGFMGASAVACYLLITRIRAGRLLSFGISLGLFMVVPGLFPLHQRALLLVLGWDLFLSAYSYLVERRTSARFDEFAFFVFVNPALVYTRRGVVLGPPRIDGRGLVRAASGVSLLFVSHFRELAEVALVTRATSLGELGGRGLGSALTLLQIYAAHVGLASLQIGVLRQLGVAAPERYRAPFSAVSPRDFWSRWNTYVGTWIRVYVFTPLALFLTRRLTGKNRRVPVVMTAVGASFVFVGLLHDLHDALMHHEIELRDTPWFLANGALVILWEGARRAMPRWNGCSVQGRWRGRALVMVLACVAVGALAGGGSGFDSQGGGGGAQSAAAETRGEVEQAPIPALAHRRAPHANLDVSSTAENRATVSKTVSVGSTFTERSMPQTTHVEYPAE